MAQHGYSENAQNEFDYFDLSLRELVKMKITATKQNYLYKDVPASLRVVTGRQLQEMDWQTLPDVMTDSPNTTMSRFASLPQYFMRGVGNNFTGTATDSSVGLHIDGIYLGLAEMASGLLWDVQRVETLYGPQGTLYGRNSSAGAIDIISNKPVLTENSQLINATTGSFGRRDLGYIGNLAVNNQHALRLAIKTANDDGYLDDRDSRGSNKSDEQNAWMGRGSWLYQITDTSSLILTADWASNHQDAASAVSLDKRGAAYPLAKPRTDFHDVRSNLNTFNELDTGGVNATLEWQTNVYQWVNIFAWRTLNYDYFFDTDATEIDISGSDQRRELDQWSEELRVNWGDRQEANGSWLAGLNLYSADTDQDFALAAYPLNQGFGSGNNGSYISRSELTTNTWSLFAEHEFSVADNWYLQLGLRYAVEEKDHDIVSGDVAGTAGLAIKPASYSLSRQDDERWSDVVPKVVLSHNYSDQLMGYASFTKGFKSGGMNSISASSTADPVNPEQVTSYELGLRLTDEKSGLLLSANIFHYDYSDLQVQTVVNNTAKLDNAAEADIDGIGLQWLQKNPRWEYSGTLNFLRARYEEFQASKAGGPIDGLDVSGNSLPQAPRWRLINQLQYRFGDGAMPLSAPISVIVRWDFRDQLYFNAFEDEEVSQGAINLWNLRLAWQKTPQLEFAIFGDNLADVDYYENILFFSSIRASNFPEGSLIGFPARGRTFGMSVNWEFQ